MVKMLRSHINSFFIAYTAVAQIGSNRYGGVTLGVFRKNFFYDCGFKFIDNIFLIYNVVKEVRAMPL